MRSDINIKNFNPFPGLRPFAPEESDLFFGREKESEEVLGKLLKNRLITVIGASGCGKSSLINCGVLTKVRSFKMKETSAWRIISFRPGNDPFGNLADALIEHVSSGGQNKMERDTILSELQNSPDGIASSIRKLKIKPDERVLLVVDQFEQLFRYSASEKTDTSYTPSAKFVDFMVYAVSQSPVNVYTIITMASEYIGECSHYQGLTQLINSSNYLVPHMGTENYKEVIEGPVKFAGANIDPDLVKILLTEIGDRTDQLPVLQHAMMRTWTQWQKLDDAERPINKNDYDSAGTMSYAMSIHANEAYEELGPRGKEICGLMFRTITQRGSDNQSLRHPSCVKIIKSIAGCTSEELFEVVQKFSISSRSFITPLQNISLNDDTIIDISYENLMLLWDRLREWIDDETASVRMYLRLSESSAMYQQGKMGLFKPPDLQLAIKWRDQHKPSLPWAERYNPAFERALVYLRTSEREYVKEEGKKISLQKRKMKRIRVVSMILGIAAIISIGFMLFAFVQKISADRQTILANIQRTVADSTATVAKQKAEEANRQIEIANNQRSLAERNTAEAVRLQNDAIKKSYSAKNFAMIAEQNAKEAIEQKNVASRLRMLSLGKSMSMKSLQLQGQKDLQALLAYQAYLFNKDNKGPENDADIYAGLYNVARLNGSSAYKSFKGHNGAIKSIAFIPGKNEFFTSGSDGQILKWSLDGKEKTLQIIYSGNDIIDVLAVSPDASWLACGGESSNIKMIPLKENSRGYDMAGHKGKIKSLIFSFDGKYLYSASLDGNVIKWDIEARTSTNVNTGAMEITSIDISSNGKYLAGLSNDGNVVVWNPESSSDNFRIETTGKNIKVIKLNPDNNLLAIGDVNGNVELWDIILRKKISEVKAHSAQVNDIQFNNTQKQMATASNDKTLKIFNITNPADLTDVPITLNDNEGFLVVMQFSPDGQMIVSATDDGVQNLICRPSNVSYLAQDISGIISRNMTQDEWNAYVAKDIPLEKISQGRGYNIKVDPIK